MEILGLTNSQQPKDAGKNKNKTAQIKRKDIGFSQVAVKFEHIKIEAEVTFYKPKQSNIQVKIENDVNTIEFDVGKTAQIRVDIHKEILAQTKEFLLNFFDENPEAVEEVKNGEIPEYFNVENTAKRILDIYFSRLTENENKSEFVERAKEIIEKAYFEVESLVNSELPEIVLKTRERVFEILDKFAAGDNISEYIEQKINPGE